MLRMVATRVSKLGTMMTSFGSQRTDPFAIEPRSLVAYAHDAGRRGSWLEANLLWTELDRVDPTDLHRVMALETGRLAGFLPLSSLSARDSPVAIIRVLGADYAQHLLADLIRRRPSPEPQVLELIEQNFNPVPESIRRALIQVALDEPATARLLQLGAEMVRLRSISSAPAQRTVSLYCGIEVDLPELQSLFEEVPVGDSNLRAEFRHTQILYIQRAVMTSESDAIEVDGDWYFDAVSYAHSHILDVTSDPIVLAASAENVAISPPHLSTDSIPSGLWLAYPLTHAWGHFVLECLTRLAILHAAEECDEETALVSRAVPESFLDFARYVYPWVKFVRVEPGASVQIVGCLIIPSRALTPGRFRWSADGNRYPNMDPLSLGLLGEHMRESLDRHGDSAPMFPSRVYVDRTSATYRRSNSENGVRAIAESHGFHVVDPGTLSPAQEVNLFVNAVDLCGFSGSQVLLTVAMRSPGRLLYFYHDESTEMRSLSYSMEICTGVRPNWILGSRARFLPGYSEQSIHQQIELSEHATSAAREWLGRDR